MASKTPSASSSTLGFFQSLPILPPQFTSPDRISSSRTENAAPVSDDEVLARILQLYLPAHTTQVTNHIDHLARLSLHPSVLAHSVDAETNHPVLRPLTTFGQENRNDPLWTTAGWQKLKEIGFEEGVVAVAYEEKNVGWNRRIHEFGLGHVWGVTATMTGCPMSMTDGAATLLRRHLDDPDGDQPGRRATIKEAYRRLTSRNPKEAWTSGQWMTERSGGSDVSGTETVASRLTSQQLAEEAVAGREYDAIGMPLGPWRIDGFKWFSSATDSEMAVSLARTSTGGLSAFYIPMRRRTAVTIPSINEVERSTPATELNGIRIQRLKSKLGTKQVPTAELELAGARGYLIGEEGKGVKEISAILNITRLHTAAGSVGNWARGLAICRAYSKVRKVRGGLLQDNKMHLRWMSDGTIKYWAAMHMTYFGIALQGALEQSWSDIIAPTKAALLIPNDTSEVYALLRLLTPVMKARVSVASVHGLRECMECLGGIGYCENNEDGGVMNVARVYRDNLVNPIWEGPGSVMAEDAVRVLVDKRLGGGDVLGTVFAGWVRRVLGSCDAEFGSEVEVVGGRLDGLVELVKGKDEETLRYEGRTILDHIEVVVCGTLLLFDASVNPDAVSKEVAIRYIQSKTAGDRVGKKSGLDWREKVEWDKRIFLGDDRGKSKRLERL